MKTHFGRNRGSVLILVTLSLVALFAIISLAVDLGWAFFVKRAAQKAADTAALAAVRAAMDDAASFASYSCGGGAECSAEYRSCRAGFSGNLSAACDYAARNGFSMSNESQDVKVRASDSVNYPTVISACNPNSADTVASPPTAPCVNTYYWVTVVVTEQIPQLFSRIFGAENTLVAARATAAVAQSEAIGSLILLNRGSDPFNPKGAGQSLAGTNLFADGSATVDVPGGIVLSSNTNSTTPGKTPAGWTKGSTSIHTPWTALRSDGGIQSANWDGLRTRPSGDMFQDPFRTIVSKAGQPPLLVAASTTSDYAVVDGQLNSTNSACTGGLCQPGNYYAVTWDKVQAKYVPSGGPIIFSDNLTFGQTNAFGTFVFFGGASVSGRTITMNPGVYAFAGTTKDSVFIADNKTNLLGYNQSDPSTLDAGRMLLFTDASYGGVLSEKASQLGLASMLHFGNVDIQSGNNADSKLDLQGLNRESSLVQSYYRSDPQNALDLFAPVVMWQDQRNSTVLYNNGYVDYQASCGGTSLDNPCHGVSYADAVTNPSTNDTMLSLWAGQHATYDGVIYQPRGAYTIVHSGSFDRGALRIVTGAMYLEGSPNLTLTSPSQPILTWVASLVE